MVKTFVIIGVLLIEIAADSDVWWIHVDNEQCFHLTEALPWHQAKAYCNKYGAHLATIHSAQENNALRDWLKSIPDSNFATAYTQLAQRSAWFGLHEIKENGSRSYQFTDGSKKDFDKWNDGQPDTVFSTSDIGGCIQINGILDGKWNEFPCEHKRAGLCQRKCSQSSQSGPVTVVCPNGCDKSWIQVGTHCYKFTESNVNWTEAYDWCTNDNMTGSLASFHSRLQIKQLTDWTRTLALSGAFIGMTDKEQSGNYKWVDGTSNDFQFWEEDHPDGSDCTSMTLSTGRWKSINCATLGVGLCSRSCLPPCESNPCQHGGWCKELGRSYSCDCYNGWTGVNCEKDFDECLSEPCFNGGSCRNGGNRFDCTCALGFLGVRCEVNINECQSDPCMNLGTCVDGANSYTCNCLSAFNGTHCETSLTTCTLQTTEERRMRIAMMATQSLSSTMCMIILGILLFVFLVLMDFSLERILHMGQELCLFFAHLLILVARAPTVLDSGAFCDQEASSSPPKFSESVCNLVAVTLHYLYFANFTFLLLDVLHSYSIYTYMVAGRSMFNRLQTILIGLGAPVPLVLFTVMFFFNKYSSDNTCWLNMNNPNVYLEILPASVILSVAVVMAEATAMGPNRYERYFPENPHSDPVKRTSAYANSKGALLIVPLNGFAWVIGIMAVHMIDLGRYTLAAVCNISLVVCFLFFHTISNQKARHLISTIFCVGKKEKTENNGEPRELEAELLENNPSSSCWPCSKKRNIRSCWPFAKKNKVRNMRDSATQWNQ